MKAFLTWAGALGTIAMVSCSVVQQNTAQADRREALQVRHEKARSYSDFVQARFASLTGDPHRAAAYYASSTRSNPHDYDLLERAVFTALIAGDVSSAKAIAANANRDALGESSLPRLVNGLSDLQAGKYSRAQKTLSQRSSSLFNDMIARCLLAWAVAEEGDTERALQLLRDVAVSDPLLSGMTLSTRAFIQLNKEDFDGALTTLEGIWDARIFQATTAEYYARLLASKGETDKAGRILRQFTTRIGQNAAIESLREDLDAGRSIAPDPLNFSRGVALSVYTPAAALAAQTRNDLSGVYFALALDMDPDLHIARTLWGDALDNANRRNDAIRILESVPDTSVFYATARGQIAWALRRENLNDEALKTAKTALAASPDRNLKIQLGDLLRSLGNLDEAEAVFTELIDADLADEQEDWRILFARGSVREQLDQWKAGEADLIRANEIAPNQPTVMNYLGYTWIDRGENLQEGLELIQRAVVLRPNSGAIVDSLGWAHYKLGNYEQAVRHLERAVELSPRDVTLNEHLGDAYWRNDRRLEASYQWNRTRRLDVDDERADELDAKIKNGLSRAQAKITAHSKAD